MLKIEYIPISEIVPYEKNPRKNDRAVDIVAKSIKEFGFNVPILLDKNNIIIAGHTRLKAAIKLGMQEVPILWLENLTEEQAKAFRIMDNKSQEYSFWDYDLLKGELFSLKSLNIDLDITGFRPDEINFLNPDINGPANNSYTEWRKSGGLDYANRDENGIQTIILHFKTEEDIKEFGKLINQTITPRTKYLWFPKQQEDSVADLQYQEDDSA